jgi:hypothetical protein
MCICAAKDRFIEFPTPTCKKPKYPIPGELVWVIIATMMSYFGQFESRYELVVVGKIPAGLLLCNLLS